MAEKLGRGRIDNDINLIRTLLPANFDGTADKYGVGVQIREHDLTTTMDYNIAATFTAATNKISLTGQTFVTDGVTVGQYLTITNASDTDYIGLVAEITAVTQTEITIEVAAAGSDALDNLTDVDFVVYNQPTAMLLDNGVSRFLIGSHSSADFRAHNTSNKGLQVDKNGTVYVNVEPPIGGYDDNAKALLIGDAAGASSFYFIGNTLNACYDAETDDLAGGWINYRGHKGGTAYFRDLHIGDGKGNNVLSVVGRERSVVTFGKLEISGSLISNGGRRVNSTRVTTTYTALVTDHVIYANTDGGSFTITLPTGVENQEFVITNCGSNTLTIDGNGAEEINGSATQTLAPDESVTVIFNTTEEWRIF